MVAVLRMMLVALALVGLTSCGAPSKFKSYNGPAVTLVEIHKADRKMYLIHDTQILKSYDIELGGSPFGPKQFEGDGKTPEGSYYITHRNPNSTYHLSLGISYPNAADVAFADSQEKKAGDNIFIHGQPGWTRVRGDWTAGCIALKDRDMEQAYAMVNPGTPINFFP